VAGRIYLLNGESKLIAMEESAYDRETLLQRLLADHPDLLAGDQINDAEPYELVPFLYFPIPCSEPPRTSPNSHASHKSPRYPARTNSPGSSHALRRQYPPD